MVNQLKVGGRYAPQSGRSKTHLRPPESAKCNQLQLNGYDMDKNVITRIETNKRYVTDVELKALTEIFNVSYEYLIEGKEKS